MNIKNKLIFIIYILMIMSLLISGKSYAKTSKSFIKSIQNVKNDEIVIAKKNKESADDFIENMTESADKWTEMAKKKAEEMDLTASTTTEPFLPMIASTSFIGQSIAFIFGMIVIIKWRLGSPDERAKSYHSMIRWVIGAIIVIAGLGIWSKLMLLGSEFANGEEKASISTKIATVYVSTKLI